MDNYGSKKKKRRAEFEARELKRKQNILKICDIKDNIKDLEPEFSKTVDENFWELM